MSEGLKSCPFCRSVDLSIHYDNETVFCRGCGSEGTSRECWNNRPIEDRLKVELEEAKKEADFNKMKLGELLLLPHPKELIFELQAEKEKVKKLREALGFSLNNLTAIAKEDGNVKVKNVLGLWSVIHRLAALQETEGESDE